MPIQNDIYSKLSYSNKAVIKALIKNRSTLDKLYKSNLYDNPSDIFISSSVFDVDQDIICIYADLDRLISKCVFNNKQVEIIDYYQRGYTTSDICDMLGFKASLLNKMMEFISLKVVEKNDAEYKDFLYTSGAVRVPADSNYKKCIKCGEFKDCNLGFFHKDSTKKDGFRAACTICSKYNS